MSVEGNKKLFIDTAREKIKREGIDDLLDWLETTDFYIAPASTKYHMAKTGGLCEHSIHVYQRLVKLYCDMDGCIEWELTPSLQESIAIVGLFHDLCKANIYTTEKRNRKNEFGQWEQYDYYIINDQFPYGHGEKSVLLLSKYIKLTDEEAFAIRYHMGSWNEDEKNNASKAFEMYPMAFYAHVADEWATFIDEKGM